MHMPLDISGLGAIGAMVCEPISTHAHDIFPLTGLLAEMRSSIFLNHLISQQDHIKKQEFELQRNYLLLQSRQATFTLDIGKQFRSRIAKSTSRKVALASHRANMRHIVECTRKGFRTTNIFLTVGSVCTKKLGHWYHKLNWAAFVVDWKTITRFCEVVDPSRHSIDLLHGRLL
jgi:hypothetical protein